ncbi:hypothetical protein C8R43DRAFT_1244267 [Mycena crocata]|nr:hypothetical protein C8R43DRAFT_1244267 [Mycena crocata]
MSSLQNPSMSTDAWWFPQDSSICDSFTEAFFTSQSNTDLPSLVDATDSCELDALNTRQNIFVVDDGDYSTSSDFLLEGNLGLSPLLPITVNTPPASTFPSAATGQLTTSVLAENTTAKARASFEPRQSLDAPSPVAGRVQDVENWGAERGVDAANASDIRDTDTAASPDASSAPNTPASIPDDDTLVADDEECPDPPSPAETLVSTSSLVEPLSPMLPAKRLPKRSKGAKKATQASPSKAGPSRLPAKASPKKIIIDHEADAAFEFDAAGCGSDSDDDYHCVPRPPRLRVAPCEKPYASPTMTFPKRKPDTGRHPQSRRPGNAVYAPVKGGKCKRVTSTGSSSSNASAPNPKRLRANAQVPKRRKKARGTPAPKKIHFCDVPGCTKSYPDSGALNRHKAAKHVEDSEKLVCNACNLKFGSGKDRQDILRRHLGNYNEKKGEWTCPGERREALLAEATAKLAFRIRE